MPREHLVSIWIAFSLILIVPLGSARAEEPMRFMEACDDQSPCLLFVPYLAPDRRRVFINEPRDVVVRVAPLNDAFTQYELSLRGRLEGGPETQHVVLLKAYTDGISCSAFGQASIPVVGFSHEGHPFALTSEGEFEITESGSLELGCRECLRLLDPDTLESVSSFTTPAWDLRAPGYRRDAFHFNEAGEVFLKTSGRCLQVHDNRGFVLRALDACRMPSETVGHFGRPAHGMQLEPGQWLLQNQDSHFLMFLKSGACT
jgi:hypothetical protein